MKILVISTTPLVLWHDLTNDLTDMGHDVEVLFYPHAGFSQSKLYGEKLVVKTKRENFDLILIIKGEIYSDNTIMELKKNSGTKIVTWLIDDPFLMWDEDGPPQYIKSATKSYKFYDKVYNFDSFYNNRFKDSGYKNTEYLPLAFSPTCYYPLDTPSIYDISFVGIGYRKRINLMSQLNKSHKYKMVLAGDNWSPKEFKGQKVTGWLDGKNTNLIYNQTKINVNINHFQSVNGSNLRTFEILGAGGFLLVEPLKDLKDLFEDGKDLVFYNDIVELKEKVEYFLVHENERKEIAANGYKKAIKNHTFKNRIAQIVKSCDIKENYKYVSLKAECAG